MDDVQSHPDARRISIDQVGVTDIHYPITLLAPASDEHVASGETPVLRSECLDRLRSVPERHQCKRVSRETNPSRWTTASPGPSTGFLNLVDPPARRAEGRAGRRPVHDLAGRRTVQLHKLAVTR
jgi:hypothetical protein